MSPSLLPIGDKVAAFELKFLLSEPMAEEVRLWAERELVLDPHGCSELDNAYRIHGLYLDTPNLDVYRRSPSYGRRKFRLRRYGDECELYVERKTKSGARVAKRRTLIMDTELSRLGVAEPEVGWAAGWFQRRLLSKRLQPTCQVTYDRTAYVGTHGDGPLRLTLDRRILCAPARDWHVAEPRTPLQLLHGQVILELKYRAALPLLFKRFVQEFKLHPQPVSKYRLAVEAWALERGTKEAG